MGTNICIKTIHRNCSGYTFEQGGSQGCVWFCWRIVNQIYEASGNSLGQSCNPVMELCQEGRHVFDRKLGLGLEEPYLGRICPEGGQLDIDRCEGHRYNC